MDNTLRILGESDRTTGAAERKYCIHYTSVLFLANMAGRAEPSDTAELIHNDLSNMLKGDQDALQSVVAFYMTMMNKI